MISLTLIINKLTLGDAFLIPYSMATIPRELLQMEGISASSISAVDLRMFTLDPLVLMRRIYSLTIDPMYYYRYITSKPNYQAFVVSGQDYMYAALYDKTPIIASDTFYLALSPIGMVHLLSMRDKRLQGLCLMVSILIAFGACTSMIIWYAGWTRFFRYHQILFPLLTVLSTVAMARIGSSCWLKVIVPRLKLFEKFKMSLDSLVFIGHYKSEGQ